MFAANLDVLCLEVEGLGHSRYTSNGFRSTWMIQDIEHNVVAVATPVLDRCNEVFTTRKQRHIEHFVVRFEQKTVDDLWFWVTPVIV